MNGNRCFWSALGVAYVLAMVLPTPLEHVSAQTQSEVVIGRDVAQRACVGCHSIDDPASVIEGREVPTFRAIAGKGWSAERLQAYIATPHRPMPGIPLDTSEIRNVATYILSLK
jgi:mono/diheme cytochrome c family protein